MALDHGMQSVLRLGRQSHHLLPLCHQSTRSRISCGGIQIPTSNPLANSRARIEAAILSFMTCERVIRATCGGCTTRTDPAYWHNSSYSCQVLVVISKHHLILLGQVSFSSMSPGGTVPHVGQAARHSDRRPLPKRSGSVCAHPIRYTVLHCVLQCSESFIGVYSCYIWRTPPAEGRARFFFRAAGSHTDASWGTWSALLS